MSFAHITFHNQILFQGNHFLWLQQPWQHCALIWGPRSNTWCTLQLKVTTWYFNLCWPYPRTQQAKVPRLHRFISIHCYRKETHHNQTISHSPHLLHRGPQSPSSGHLKLVWRICVCTWSRLWWSTLASVREARWDRKIPEPTRCDLWWRRTFVGGWL